MFDSSAAQYRQPNRWAQGEQSRQPQRRIQSEQPTQPKKGSEGVTKIWVVIINPGRADEGVYTLQDLERKKQDRIIAFEARDDAKRFAQKLSGLGTVAPMQWDSRHLEDFAKQGGFETNVVSEGTPISPPEMNEHDVESHSQPDSQPSGATTLAPEEDEESLPLHRRLHLRNLRALLEERLKQQNMDENEEDYDPEDWQA
jgi:hypothetical protein